MIPYLDEIRSIGKQISSMVTNTEPVDPKHVIDYLVNYPDLCLSPELATILTKGKVILMQPSQLANWPNGEVSGWSQSHILVGHLGFFTLPSGRPNPWIVTERAAKNRWLRLPATITAEGFQESVVWNFINQVLGRWRVGSFSELTFLPFMPFGRPSRWSIADVLFAFECCRLRKYKIDNQSLDFLRGLVKLCPYAGLSRKRGILYLCDRPKTWKTISPEDVELHCEDGPAVEYRGGWKDYFLEGVRVPSWVVTHPELITVESIMNESNTEVRRLMRQKYGEGQFLFDSGAKIIDVDTKDVSKVDFTESRSVPRMLVEVGKGVSRERFLVGTDGSTGRVYYMLVSQDAQTCQEAHNQLAGFDENIIISQS